MQSKKYGKYLLQVCIASLLLEGCSEKEPLRGTRENILSSEGVGDLENSIDKSPVIIDEEIANVTFPQPYINATHCYAPLKFSVSATKQWSAKLDFEATKSIKMVAAPIVADGKVFCVDAGGIVYAFNAKTGDEIWRRSVTIAGKDGQTGAAIAYDGGRLIVSSCFSECFSLNAKTGAINWRIKLPAACKGDSITISDGRVFLMCSNSTLQVVDIDNGKLLWTHSGITSDSVFLGGAGVAVADGVAYFAYPSGEIFALLVETGAPIWESAFPKFSISNAAQAFTHPKASPVVKDGVVYFVAANEQAAAYNAKTGERLWIKDYGGIQTPIVSGNSIFVFNSRSELVCLNRLTGNLRWKSILDSLDSQNKHDWYGMILLKNHILTVSPEGNIAFVSAKNGKIERLEATGEAFAVNPIVADSTLYILSNDGEISAYK